MINWGKVWFTVKYYFKYYVTVPLYYLMDRVTKPKFYRDIFIMFGIWFFLSTMVWYAVLCFLISFSFHVWNKLRSGDHNKAYLDWMIKKSTEREEDEDQKST